MKGSRVWWKGDRGPEHVVAEHGDWDNMKDFPECYSNEKPRYTISYLD